MGLDTASGLLRIVVNGREVVNMEKDYFRNTTSWKSDTVDGKVLGKSKQQKISRISRNLICHIQNGHVFQYSKATGEDSGTRTETPSPT